MNKFHRIQTGFTLIELMIAMLLGLLLTGALLTMLAQARVSFQQDEFYARMLDESRFAMRELSRDVSMAGYIGDIMVPGVIDLDASLAIDEDCERADGESFAYRLTDSVSGVDTSIISLDNITTAAATTQFGCLEASELVAGTDIVAVKKLSGAPATALQVGDVALRNNGTVGALFVEPIDAAIPAPFEDRLYTPAIYFIRNYTETAGDGNPALCRKILVGGATATMETECIAAGIENLQVEYGIDTNGDGSVDRYLPDPTDLELEGAVSARLYLLARTPDEERSYTNDKTYSISNSDDFEPADSFRRRVYTTTVNMLNKRNRQVTGI
jgi:type IV pilus assembly protein PilW